MPIYLNSTSIKSTVAIDTKKIDEVNPKETKQVEAPVNKDIIALHDLLSDHQENENESDEEESYNSKSAFKYNNEDSNDSSSTPNKDSIKAANPAMAQSINIENLEKLGCLNITFRKGKNYKQWEVANIVNQIKTEPQDTKLVKLSFQSCKYIKDLDLANLGAGLNSKLGSVEYLNLSFWSSRRTTIFGIQELIREISGQGNTLKSLRLRIRGHWYLANQSLKDLVKGLRASLVNLEELHIVLSGNLWVTSSGVKAIKDDQRVIEGLGLGLKKYMVSDNWCLASLFKDNAGKDMSQYVMEKFKKMDVKEGALVSNKMFVYFKRIFNSKVVNSKIVLEEVNKSA